MLNLNQQLKRVEIKEFEIENSVVFNYFDNIPSAERGEKLLRAIYIGVLALMEDRISAFLSAAIRFALFPPSPDCNYKKNPKLFESAP